MLIYYFVINIMDTFKKLCDGIGGRIEGETCKIDKKIKIDEDTEYELFGPVVVTGWYNQKGFATLLINTDEKGYKEIKEEPLQDYLSFGVQSVDFVDFSVTEKKIFSFEEGDKKIKVIVEREKERITEGDTKAIENFTLEELYSNITRIRY